MDSFLFGKRRISFSFLRSFFLRSLSPIFSDGMWYGFPFDLKFYVFCSFFLLFLKELLKRSRKFLFWKTGRGIYRSENPAPQVFYALGAHSGDFEWIFTVSESGEVYFHIVLLFHSEGRFHRPLSVLYPNSDDRLIKSWPIAFPKCVKWRSLSWISVNSYRFGRGRSSFSYPAPLSFWRPLSPIFVCLISEFRWNVIFDYSFSLRFSALF